MWIYAVFVGSGEKAVKLLAVTKPQLSTLTLDPAGTRTVSVQWGASC